MDTEIIQQIFSHLYKKGFLSGDVPITEDSFVEKLYIINDERKKILKALMSSFSEDYRNDLERAVVLESELAKKIFHLDFVEKGKQFNFVLGKCTKEEQQAVYEKMFMGLHYVLIAQETCPKKFPSTLLTEDLLSKPGIELSANELKKLAKKEFNLDKAVKNLEMARNTLENATQFMEQRKHLFKQTSQPKLEFKQHEESKLLELSNAAKSFKLMMEKNVSMPSESRPTEESPLAVELGNAVGELYPVLQFVADSTKSSSSEGSEQGKRFDLEKMLAQAEEMENNSALAKCFTEESLP